MVKKKESIKMTQPEAIAYMQQIVDGKDEAELDGKILDFILSKWHNIYLQAISKRDYRRSK